MLRLRVIGFLVERSSQANGSHHHNSPSIRYRVFSNEVPLIAELVLKLREVGTCCEATTEPGWNDGPSCSVGTFASGVPAVSKVNFPLIVALRQRSSTDTRYS